MQDSVFEVIHNNQTLISATITILVLGVASLTATGFTLRSVLESENIVSYLHYQRGFRDATLRAPSKTFLEFRQDDLVAAVQEIVLILKSSCYLTLVACLLHVLSSAWTIFKRSPMARTIWLLAQLAALILLLTAVSMPMSYQLRGPLVLNIYFATLLVDASLTLLLLLVVQLDNKFPGHSSNPNFERDPEKIQSNVTATDDATTSQPTPTVTNVSLMSSESNGTQDEELQLPPPPPPPVPSTATTTTTSNAAA